MNSKEYTVTILKNNELEKKRKRLEVKEQQDRNVREAEERARLRVWLERKWRRRYPNKHRREDAQ